jgi:NADH-quinone oxidoreductase subunit J
LRGKGDRIRKGCCLNTGNYSNMLQTLAFYLFAIMTLLSAAMVITARNPVHSVLFLILAFFNAAGLFVLLGAEFVAMILVIVYVGAVAVLFLFVVMMLDMGFAELRKGAMQYVPLGLVIGAVLLVELAMIYAAWQFAPDASANLANPEPADIENTKALGMLLYTDYVYPFQAAGLILLVAMIGAIVLTHRQRAGVRRQKIAEQNNRRREDVLTIAKVNTGEGV